MLNKFLKYGGAILVLLLFLVVFGIRCPIEQMTGFPCPGCNMTTSAYWLFIKGDFQTSLYFHALLIPTIVCFCIGLYSYYKKKMKWVQIVLVIWALMMLGYYIFRMVYVFPEFPMEYQTDSMLGEILSYF